MSTISEELGKISRSFKDISFNLLKNPITNDIVVLKNEEAIKQSVKNLVLTKLGERLFNPLVGTNTNSYLFELTTTFSINTLIQEIEEVLKNFEKRIRLSNITINSEEDSNEFNVFIEYYIVGLPQSLQNVEFLLVRES
jgi:phage baseplate assembly protein W